MNQDELLSLINVIRSNLGKGLYSSEAAVAQGIVLPILQAIGWPIYDPSVVIPEFGVGGRRVDYALCYPPKKAYVFIEVKRVGNSFNADRQLFEYAFHEGIPLAVLTDGREWGFYLPGEQGSYDERRVYKIDLFERKPVVVAEKLIRYLSYTNVASGAAIENARSDYRSVSKSRIIKQHLPIAWNELLRNEEQALLELLAEKVEDLCGYKPSVDVCGHFLSSMIDEYAGHPQHPHSSEARPSANPPHVSHKRRRFILGFDDVKVEMNAKSALVKLFEYIAENDPNALDRFASQPHGRKRRYLSKNKYALYPDRVDLANEYSVEIPGGWWLGTNYSSKNIVTIMHGLLGVTDPAIRTKITIEVRE